MTSKTRNQLIKIAREVIPGVDVSHDFEHAKRVLANAERIAKAEGADLDIIIPAALFHDSVVYPKDHPNRYKSQEESAELATSILDKINEYPKEKIEKVKTCILECSFSKGIMPELLESKVLQDADGLEATGAVAIMRTYSSSGQMKRPFYHPADPFCTSRQPEDLKYALDHFYNRLLKVGDRMHTKTAKQIAKRRTAFLRAFIKEVDLELQGK